MNGKAVKHEERAIRKPISAGQFGCRAAFPRLARTRALLVCRLNVPLTTPEG